MKEEAHIKDSPIPASPVMPIQYDEDYTIKFECKPGISCWNACCKAIDITLTPYDIVRLKNRLGMTSAEFLAAYTVPYEMDADGLPGVKFRTEDEAPVCLFVQDEGCSVYEDRPTSCRYYPIGLVSQRKQDEYVDNVSYAVVVEDHCKGHDEDREITIKDYRKEQGVEDYDKHGRAWRQLILKKKSSGPSIGKPSKRSLQIFFMASYNIDTFREFIKSEGFSQVYELTDEHLEVINGDDDVAFLGFSMKFITQLLYGEDFLVMKTDAEDSRVARRREMAAEEQAGKGE
ncbi:MAG: YkgJ family cysteine cluster protein [Gammaproteobacteria bacterium]|nr:YkgJ family cysteine cluster protein [Gammaproteobacteria bacterium]